MEADGRPPLRRAGLLLLAAALGCRSGAQVGEENDRAALVDFEGNREVSAKDLRSSLKEDLQRFVQHGGRESDLSDLAFEVERLYRGRGYHFVRAAYRRVPPQAVIEIEEGPRVVVEEVRFQGNKAIGDRQLNERLSAKRTGILGFGKRIYVEREVQALAGAVEDAYFEKGYQEVQVEDPETRFSPDRSRATITVRLLEGRQYVLKSIVLESVPLIDAKALNDRLSPHLGTGYVPRLRLEARGAVEEAYADQGYPDARADVEMTAQPGSPPDSRVDVSLFVRARPGPRVLIRAVVLEGNDELKSTFILSRLTVKPGDVYHAAEVRRSFHRLYSTGLFKSVDIHLSPPGPDASQRDLLIKVAEGTSLEYFFELGFGSYDLARAKAGVRERDFLGRGLVGRAEVQGSIRGAQATVGLTDPWFLRTDWVADLPVSVLQREEPSFTIQEAQVRFRLSRKFWRWLEGGGVYRFSLSHLEDLAVTEPVAERTDLTLGAAGPFVEIDTRDDIFAPTRGAHSRIFGEMGSPALGGEISFFHTGFTTSHYVQVVEGSVLAGTVQTAWIVPTGGTDLIPIQERLFAGGENSVRSFGQSEVGPKDPRGKPLGGEVRNLVSAELRQRIRGQLWGAVFGDYGNVAPATSDAFRDFRPAVGVGLRFALPIGPARIDVGFNPAHRRGEDLFALQFAVGLPY